MIRKFCILLVLLALLSACSPGDTSDAEQFPPSSATPTLAKISDENPSALALDPPDHIIGIRQSDGQGEFYNQLTGEEFTVRGVNYVYVPDNGSITNLTLKVGVYNAIRTRQDFEALASKGYNTVRVFLDHCSSGPGCIGDTDNIGLNQRYLMNIADLLTAAKETGLYVLYTSNDLPDQGGYSEEANSQSGAIFAGYRNSYYLTEEAVSATRRYWQDILTGLRELNAPTDQVLAWQLLNEQWMFLDQPPLSLDSGLAETTTGVYDMSDPDQKKQMVSDGLIHYIQEVKSEILQSDPTALVTMGFFAPEIVAPGWYVETASLLAGSELDFFDFHGYPGDHSLAELAAAFNMEGYDAKPIILGEYGSFRHLYPDQIQAARATTAWQSESCEYGFDGWLYWAYYPASAAVNDRTWGFTDDGGYFMDLLAPSIHPDPCEQVPIGSNNLAFQKPVRVSAILADEMGQNAVDEIPASQWGSGGDAPQWIEIDLEGSYQISEIKLQVAQWPAGDTIHQVSGRSPGGTFTVLHTFNQITKQGDLLVFSPASPIDNISHIRIDTVSSPSWVAWSEIQVFGEALD